MKLQLIRVKDDIDKVKHLYVVDEDNYMLPFKEINNFLNEYSYYSLNRRIAIAHDLIHFFHWLEERQLDFHYVTRKDVLIYRDYINQEPDMRFNVSKALMKSVNIIGMIDPKTKDVGSTNKKVSVVSKYYEYLKVRDVIAVNPCQNIYRKGKGRKKDGLLSYTKKKGLVVNPLRIRRFRTIKKNGPFDFERPSKKEPFTYNEVQQIIGLLKNPQEVLLICMLFLGLRISDALGRRINDIKWADRIIEIIQREDDPDDGSIKYDSERQVPIRGVLYFSNLAEVMKEAYDQYVAKVLRPKSKLNAKRFLFINLKRNTKTLTYENIYKRIIKTNLQRNMNREITFHSFRHHWATTSIALGMPLEEVQRCLGHRHLSTTINDYYNPSIVLIKNLVEEG